MSIPADTYRDPAFLRSQIDAITGFYDPVVIDHEIGGYFDALKDDGTVYDRTTRHLVGTCRFIYNYSVASMLTGDTRNATSALHGLAFLRDAHRLPDGGYAWVLSGRDISDGTRHAYGHAFVLLAAATAAKASIDTAWPMISELYDLLESHFWSPDAQLYVDAISPDDWSTIDPYRGQNANMHMCEAMIAAHEATGEARYLDRAYLLARRICVDLASKTNGLIWEHFTPDWKVDWTYNIDDPKNLFRPYGYLSGHFVEWARLLVTLHGLRPEPWMTERAQALFKIAVDMAWDSENGGMHYSFAPDGTILDTDRYYWVLAEAIAAAALLASHTGDPEYWSWYDAFWDYSHRHLIDHDYGGWYRVLDLHGRKYDDLKSPPAKTDYHPLSACYTALQALGAA
jgi:mannose/cellobiose epimerase-like protein (N-acyl-D-glucosamine 2-epimerase family)